MTSNLAVLILSNIAVVFFFTCSYFSRKAAASINQDEYNKLTDESDRMMARYWPGKKLLLKEAQSYAIWRNCGLIGGLYFIGLIYFFR